MPVNDVPVNDIPVNEIANQAAIFSPLPQAGTTLGQNRSNLIPGVTLGDLRDAYQGGDLPNVYTLGSLGGWGGTTIQGLLDALSNVTPTASLSQVVLLLGTYAGEAPAPTLGDFFLLLQAIDSRSGGVNLTLAEFATLLYNSPQISLADLLATILQGEDLSWESVDLDGLEVQRFVANPQAGSVRMDVTVTMAGSAAGEPVDVTVPLPPGFVYLEGSSELDLGSDAAPIDDPVVENGTLTWTLPLPAPGQAILYFRLLPGLTLGPAVVEASAAAGALPAVQAPTPVALEVEQSLEPSAVGAPQPLAATEFVLTHVATTGDTDYFQLPAPPAGTRFTVRLGQLPADYDLVVYGPGGQILRPEKPTAVPLDGVLPDDGFAPSHEVEAITRASRSTTCRCSSSPAAR